MVFPAEKPLASLQEKKKKELVVLCSPRESMLLKKFLAQTDPGAFVTVLHVDTVWGSGKGFTSIEKDI